MGNTEAKSQRNTEASPSARWWVPFLQLGPAQRGRSRGRWLCRSGSGNMREYCYGGF